MLAAREAELAGASERQPEHLVEMPLVTVPADADADITVGAEHLAHAALRQIAEAYALPPDVAEPIRNRIAVPQLLQRIVVAEAERLYAPVAFKRAELKRLQRQLRNARGQLLLGRFGDELAHMAHALGACCLIVKERELRHWSKVV